MHVICMLEHSFRAGVSCDELWVTILFFPPQITCSFSQELYLIDFLEMFVFSHSMTGAYNYYCCVENCMYYLHAGVQTFRADVSCDEVCITTLLCPPQITCSFS